MFLILLYPASYPREIVFLEWSEAHEGNLNNSLQQTSVASENWPKKVQKQA